MSDKYTHKRPPIPAQVKRSIKVESGHACAIKNCNEHTYLECHHIDGNRENNRLSNLIYVCGKHHKMAHSGEIDRKALKEYKNINSTNSSSQVSQQNEKRKRDIDNAKRIVSTIHFPTLDEHISNLPRIISHPIFHYWELFEEVMHSSLFHLYDEELRSIFNELYRVWGISLSFPGRYQGKASGVNSYYIFSNFGGAPLNESQEKDWRIIEKAARDIYTQKNRLLSHLRENYIEVNVSVCNKKAWDDYKSYNKD